MRERDLVGRQGLFVAEGEVVVRVLARSPTCEPVSLLLAEKRIVSLTDVIDALPPTTAVYSAPQAVMDAIVGFPIHRGILALGRRRETLSAGDLLGRLGEDALVLALCGIGNHDNMGGLFRNAAAFGIDAVLVDSDCCDPLYRKAIRVSVGAALLTPFARLGAEDDLLALLGRHAITPVALSPAGDVRLSDLEREPRMAAILGSEGRGLAPGLLARARTVRIPMAAGFDSLNVAVTAGVVLHQLAASRS